MWHQQWSSARPISHTVLPEVLPILRERLGLEHYLCCCKTCKLNHQPLPRFRKKAPNVSARIKLTYIQINCPRHPEFYTQLGKVYQGPGHWRTAARCVWNWKRNVEGQVASQQELQEGLGEVAGSSAGQGRAARLRGRCRGCCSEEHTRSGSHVTVRRWRQRS